VAGDQDAARRAHAEYYLGFAQEVVASHERWLAVLAGELDNLRAALNWALAGGDTVLGVRLASTLTFFWWRRGAWQEGAANLERAIEQAADVSPALRAEVLSRAGWLASGKGHYARAEVLLSESLVLYRSCGDMRGIAIALGRLGSTLGAHGAYEEAERLLQEALEQNRSLSNEVGEAFVHNALAEVARERGEHGQALAYIAQSEALRKALGEPIYELIQGRADVLLNMGKVADAGALYQRAREEALAFDEAASATFSLRGLGRTAFALGDAVQARTQFEASVEAFREAGREEGLTWPLHHLSAALETCGERPKAIALLGEALALQQREGNRHRIAESLEIAAQIASGMQQRHQAVQWLAVADALRAASAGAPVPPLLHTAQERLTEMLRTALGAATFDAAWQAGQERDWTEVVAEVLALV
jgi:tetratricopeptide (TPR) repeat protein